MVLSYDRADRGGLQARASLGYDQAALRHLRIHDPVLTRAHAETAKSDLHRAHGELREMSSRVRELMLVRVYTTVVALAMLRVVRVWRSTRALGAVAVVAIAR